MGPKNNVHYRGVRYKVPATKRFCHESFTVISSVTKKNVRCREVYAIKDVRYKKIPLYIQTILMKSTTILYRSFVSFYSTLLRIITWSKKITGKMMPRENEKENTVTQKNSNILLSITAPHHILAYQRYPIWAFSFLFSFLQPRGQTWPPTSIYSKTC